MYEQAILNDEKYKVEFELAIEKELEDLNCGNIRTNTMLQKSYKKL